MVTLCIGFTRNRIAGIVLVSAMGAVFTVKYFRFMGIETGMNSLFIAQLILSFASNLILGYLFVTRGLLYSMVLKFIFSMKFVLVALLLG